MMFDLGSVSENLKKRRPAHEAGQGTNINSNGACTYWHVVSLHHIVL